MSRTPLANALKHIFQLAKVAREQNLSPDEVVERRARALLSRRQAMERALGAAIALPFAGLAWREAMAVEVIKRFHAGRGVRRHIASVDGPVVIIGAGTAGLTAAYRLTQAHVPVAIYEGSQRVGGRMYTQHDFNKDKMFCERGGELVDSDHTSLIDLAHEVGVQIQPLSEIDPTLNLELYYIDGNLYNIKELFIGFQPLAEQILADQYTIYGKNAVDTPTYKTPFNSLAFDRMTLKEYLASKKNVEKWVLDLVDICYIGEYGLESDQQSAINLIAQVGTKPQIEKIGKKSEEEYKLLGESDESRRIKGGSATLPETLAAHLAHAAPVHFQHELIKIVDNGSEFTLTFNNNGKTVDVRAAQIISAIPLTLLRRVEGVFDLDLNPRKKKFIQEFGYGTNAKMMTGYKGQYWRQLGPERKSNGLVYSTTFGQEFWETSRKQPGTSGIMTSFMGGDVGKNIKLEDLSKTLAAMEQVFPGAQEQFDGNKAFQHWPSYKFTRGSYACPSPGQYNEVIGTGADAELNQRFIMAGEHTSVEYLGFMDGAVESGDRAADDVLKSRGVKSLKKPKSKSAG